MEKEDLKKMLEKAEIKLEKLKSELILADSKNISNIRHDMRNQETIINFCKTELE